MRTPILKLATEWMSVFRNEGITPSSNLLRACIKRELIASGEHDRLDELDFRLPSEEAQGRFVSEAMKQFTDKQSQTD